MIISKKMLIIIAALFLLLNFVLIYKNYTYQYKINELMLQIVKLEELNNSLINSND